MFSNHLSALPLVESDRRVRVIENPSKPRSDDYYAELYGLLHRTEFSASVREYFRRLDLAGFNPGERAPLNEAKRAAIEASKSDIDRAVQEIADEYPTDVVFYKDFCERVGTAMGEYYPSRTTKAAIKHAMHRTGALSMGMVLPGGSGNRERVWILRNVDEWRYRSLDALKCEALRGRKMSAKMSHESGKI